MFKWLYGPILITKADRLGTYAAALAYCFVLSLVPFLIVTFTLASDVGSSMEPKLELGDAYKDLLADILPSLDVDTAPHPKTAKNNPFPNGPDIIDRQSTASAVHISAQVITTLQNTSHRGLATVGFILAVYTSFNLMEQIVRTLLFIFDDPRRPHEWSWLVVVKTIALLFIWMFLLLLISIISVVTPVIQKILVQIHLNSALWTAPLLVTRDLVLAASLFGAFFLTYYLVPAKRYRLAQVRDGSLVASCGWVLCSLLFAYVLPSMWRTNAVYEALGSVVVILLWAQACAWSVIIGACWIVRFSPRGR